MYQYYVSLKMNPGVENVYKKYIYENDMLLVTNRYRK